MDFESEEEDSFVNYAVDLDDSKSATWAIATDDDKAIKFFQKNFPHLQILSDPEIIKHWSEKQSIDSIVLSNVLNTTPD